MTAARNRSRSHGGSRLAPLGPPPPRGRGGLRLLHRLLGSRAALDVRLRRMETDLGELKSALGEKDSL
ncbi:hypothetical protein [Candidatus Methanocrinis natronophilus]|uniref:Uncharacterized protein n=1 Tax=Candidatus Methanocrinis natronophilus TaxID=3033396 RepID=A0ABT5XB07_9EURY|nr:hypothetical protein [Candidatus Methanocrinis natronophilus]MDF0591901.1 hypothetical protein [Candidatus Methanocrinis natronophilus]